MSEGWKGLTAKQEEGARLLASGVPHILLGGGSRSGKTFLIVRTVAVRALKAPGSRHAMLRFKAAHIKQSMVMDTFPKMMRLCFPGVEYELNKSDLFARIDTRNGEPSEIWFGGLDDKDRVEKILGNEYATIFLNECSQITWDARNMVVTRLAQKVTEKVAGRPDRDLPLRMYYDENPPDKGHWTYRLFIQKLNPETKQPLPNPKDYAYLQVNPTDNADNLPASYFTELDGLSARMRRRFRDGLFRDAAPNALFTDETIDKWRVVDEGLPDMQRIVIAVDPSGSDDTDNAENDEIGIVVAGLGTDGNGYVLEDLTLKVGPAGWGKVVSNAYDRWEADRIVAETNFGGAMVKSVIQSARRAANGAPMPFRAVTASRGKVVRAEPVSALVEQGRVRFVGYLRKMEDELTSFTTSGYIGENSPNRADAFVWAITELFPSLVKPEVQPPKSSPQPVAGPQGWLG